VSFSELDLCNRLRLNPDPLFPSLFWSMSLRLVDGLPARACGTSHWPSAAKPQLNKRHRKSPLTSPPPRARAERGPRAMLQITLRRIIMAPPENLRGRSSKSAESKIVFKAWRWTASETRFPRIKRVPRWGMQCLKSGFNPPLSSCDPVVLLPVADLRQLIRFTFHMSHKPRLNAGGKISRDQN